MKTLNLSTAQVVGFFSLPSPALAEHNPDAYNNAMADAPEGAGTCANCGNGIRHHVIAECDGRRFFIGTDCAARIGGEVAECARYRITSAAKAERAGYYASVNAARAEQEREIAARVAERKERFADVLAVLNNQGTGFHQSLAEQLSNGALSWKQAAHVLKAVFGRRNKRNASFFDHMEEALTAEETAAA